MIAQPFFFFFRLRQRASRSRNTLRIASKASRINRSVSGLPVVGKCICIHICPPSQRDGSLLWSFPRNFSNSGQPDQGPATFLAWGGMFCSFCRTVPGCAVAICVQSRFIASACRSKRPRASWWCSNRTLMTPPRSLAMATKPSSCVTTSLPTKTPSQFASLAPTAARPHNRCRPVAEAPQPSRRSLKTAPYRPFSFIIARGSKALSPKSASFHSQVPDLRPLPPNSPLFQ
jgi:hypothetical protein